MIDRGFQRARHIKDSIVTIRKVLTGRTYDDVRADIVVWSAFERLLEIISEASRHLPDSWKAEFGQDIPWRNIADLGNRLRHAYDALNAPLLWRTYEVDLAPLEAAVDAMLAAHSVGSKP